MTDVQKIRTFRTPDGKGIIIFPPDDHTTKNDIPRLPGRPRWDSKLKGYVLALKYWPEIKGFCEHHENRMRKDVVAKAAAQEAYTTVIADAVERVRTSGGEYNVQAQYLVRLHNHRQASRLRAGNRLRFGFGIRPVVR